MPPVFLITGKVKSKLVEPVIPIAAAEEKRIKGGINTNEIISLPKSFIKATAPQKGP